MRTVAPAARCGALLLAVAVLVTGCGGEGEAAAEKPPIPEDCLASWNAESASLQFGQHVYEDHGTANAQILLVEPSESAINIKGEEACTVVFAVQPNDYEYGNVGLVITSFGWASMRELARGDQTRLFELQEAANEAPNATLYPDGTLSAN